MMSRLSATISPTEIQTSALTDGLLILRNPAAMNDTQVPIIGGSMYGICVRTWSI
jgi:hypothetical protein